MDYDNPHILFEHHILDRIARSVEDAITAIEKNSPLTHLCDIMGRFKSDKGSGKHNYTQLYARLFQGISASAAAILEVGIGTNYTDIPSSMGPSGVPGASLRGWREFFPTARIYGADVDRRILFTESRIQTYYVDQLDRQTIIELFATLPGNKLDIIIDDGLHRFEANRNLLEIARKHLKPDGFYIIEDIYVSKENIAQYETMIIELGLCGAIIHLPNQINKDNDNCLAVLMNEVR